MIQQKLSKLKGLIDQIDRTNIQFNTKIDSIDLISSRLSRAPKKTISSQQTPKTSKTLKTPKQSPQRIPLKKQQQKLILNLQMVQKLYKNRCLDLRIESSQSSWMGFLKTLVDKNGRVGAFDFSGFNLGGRSQNVVNKYVLNADCGSLDLSGNIVEIVRIPRLECCQNLRELYLENCGLHNEQLDILFNKLQKIPIKILSLSSPNLKDRNNLTKYDSLVHLIQSSKTLHSLLLSNIQINPNNPIFQSTKNSPSLKRIDLSKNTGVIGICKNLQELNLSWNQITSPKKLAIKDSQMKVLNLSGNPIPQYYFQQFLTAQAFPSIIQLNLSRIVLNHQVPILQNFIDKSHNLKKLQLVSCQLSKASMKYIFYGIENNKNLETLNISQNKFPVNKDLIEIVQSAFQKARLVNLIMHQCEITDEVGANMFRGLRDWEKIRFIDVSKNFLSVATSNRLCEQLKNGCKTLYKIILEQNTIKYDQLKQIKSYTDRNIFMSRIHIRTEHQTLKQISTNKQMLTQQIQKYSRELDTLKKEANNLETQYMNKIKVSKQNQVERIRREIQAMEESQRKIYGKIESVEKEIQDIEKKIFEKEEQV